MGRPTNAEIAAKKAAEEEKRKADALAQQITGAEERERDSANDDGAKVPAGLPEDKPESVRAEPVEDMQESTITAPTFKAEYVTYDHTVKVNGKFYATGEKVPVH